MRRVLLMTAFLVSSPTYADVELTPAIGFRVGAEVETNRVTDSRVKTSPSFGLTLDFDLKPTRWVTVLWSVQRTEIEDVESLPDADSLGIDVHYLHAGGVYRPMRDKKTQPFVMISGGLTWVVPDRGSFDSDGGLSLAVGGGWIVPLDKRLAFRFDARAYMTFSTITLSGTCGGTGCSVRFSGGGALQLEGLFGLSIPF
jgi:hypothetical protein